MRDNDNPTFALKDGKMVSIDEVERGLECGCVCPICGSKLVAKKGDKVAHHFAHYDNSNCSYGYQTALHLVAKDIINQAKEIYLPSLYAKFNISKPEQVLVEGNTYKIENVKLEKKYGDIIPDLLITCEQKEIIVEIFVTHKVDSEKLRKIELMNVPAIEIDLSSTNRNLTRAELTSLILGNSPLKYWIYSPTKIIYEETLKKLVNHMPLCSLESNHVCNFFECDDACKYGPQGLCISCKFCIQHRRKEALCTAGKRIGSIKDFVEYCNSPDTWDATHTTGELTQKHALLMFSDNKVLINITGGGSCSSVLKSLVKNYKNAKWGTFQYKRYGRTMNGFGIEASFNNVENFFNIMHFVCVGFQSYQIDTITYEKGYNRIKDWLSLWLNKNKPQQKLINLNN